MVGYLKAVRPLGATSATVSDAAARVADAAAVQAHGRAEQARLVAGDALVRLDECANSPTTAEWCVARPSNASTTSWTAPGCS